MFKLCKKCFSGTRIHNLDPKNPIDQKKIKEGYKQKAACPVCGSIEYLKENLETNQQSPFDYEG